MNEIEILQRIASNLEQTKVIKNIIQLADQDPFVDLLENKLHIMRIQTANLIEQYKQTLESEEN